MSGGQCEAQRTDLRLGPRIPTCELPANHGGDYHKDGGFTWSVKQERSGSSTEPKS